ncbi:MAG: DUF2892 domain-containing protein [Crocinitomicaceae bacterium]|nr:DUF2892 domain-containing protein [Crocinitomicaceae bacterium]MBK8926493.1 DUF2892 domain-containing protein [Crocinitomicaceae bacterium]
MIALLLKLVLSLSSLAYTVYLFATGHWGWGIVFIFVSALFILFIFRNERIILAINQLRLQNIDKAVVHLNKIKQPQFLLRRQRAYYFYLCGTTGAGGASTLGQKESLFRKALSIGLKRDTDKAMAKMHLAAICMSTGRRNEADNLLVEAKKLDKDGLLSEHLKSLKKQMGKTTSANQIRQAQMMKGRGGKMR